MLDTVLFAADAGASDVFPLFSPSNAPTLIFWGLVTFFASYFFLAPRLISRSEELIGDREGAIEQDLAAAETANQAAAELLAQYEEKLATARSDASTAVRSVLDEAQKKSIAAENRVAKKIIKQTADADDRIRAALAEVDDALKDSAAETAQATVARLAGLKVTKAVAKSAVKARG